MNAARYLTELAARGRYHFTTDEAAARLGSGVVAARAALRRLKAKGEIAVPYRSFHVIVPPEYRSLGCLPPEQFVPQLMAHLGASYYVGLLSAAQFHGAAHQQPQQFQVMTERNRPPIRCGRVHVVFVARRNVRQMPTTGFNTPRGPVAVSTPEATAVDLVTYPEHCGGLDNVATVLAALVERLDAAKLLAVMRRGETPVIQRLGFLLERVEAGAVVEPLARHVARLATHVTPLSPGVPMRGAPRAPRWQVAVNVDVE